MKIKIIVLVAIVIAIITATVMNSSSTGKQKPSERIIAELEDKEKRQKLTLNERVQSAKARGQKKIVAPGMITLYPVAGSPEELDGLLSNFTVVIAQPVASHGYVESEVINTWYKFKILDTFSQAPPRPSFRSLTKPEALQPASDEEFLLHVGGGNVVIDGVEIASTEEGMPVFQTTQKYLFILSLDPTTRIAELAVGPQSFLPLNHDSSPDKRHAGLLRDVLARHGNSVEHLKTNLKSRHARQ